MASDVQPDASQCTACGSADVAASAVECDHCGRELLRFGFCRPCAGRPQRLLVPACPCTPCSCPVHTLTVDARGIVAVEGDGPRGGAA